MENNLTKFEQKNFSRTPRSDRWDDVRDEFILKNPLCAFCGSSTNVEVHHIKPFHEAPELELCEDNLISLCDSYLRCHFVIGHNCNWRTVNPNVREVCLQHANQKNKTE